MPLHSPTRTVPEVHELLSIDTPPTADPGEALIEVVGEVDHYTTPLLASSLFTQANRRGLRRLVVDLERVTFLAGAGLAALLRTWQQCQSLGAELIVRCNGRHRPVLRPLELAGLSWLREVPGTTPTPARPAERQRHTPACAAGPRRTAPC